MQNKYGLLIEVASRQIKQAFQKKLQLSGVDITVDQWVVLDNLFEGPKSQIQVVEAVYKDAPTVTRIVDLLCQKGLAVRNPDPTDRRKFMVALTSRGQEQVEVLRPVVDGFRAQGWRGLGEQDYQHLHRVMTTIVHNFGIENAEILSTETSSVAAKVA